MDIFRIKIDKNLSYDSSFIDKLDINKQTEIVFEYISDFSSSKVLREFLSNLSEKINIESIWKSRIILIVDELNNNAIEYWTKIWDYNIIRIFLHRKRSNLDIQIEVEDKWNWLRPKTAEEMEELRKNRLSIDFKKHNSIRWRGLFLIITKLVDSLYFKNSSNWGLIVWIKKEIKIS